MKFDLHSLKQLSINRLIFAYVFITCGLVINIIQLSNLILIWPFSKHLYRKINIYLTNSVESSEKIKHYTRIFNINLIDYIFRFDLANKLVVAIEIWDLYRLGRGLLNVRKGVVLLHYEPHIRCRLASFRCIYATFRAFGSIWISFIAI